LHIRAFLFLVKTHYCMLDVANDINVPLDVANDINVPYVTDMRDVHFRTI